ncbi:MAG: hypothetical protein ACRERX_00400 [Pseudomonas sp.]
MPEALLPLTPEQRINELEEKLALANQKARFFEAVVDVLQHDSGISVLKMRPGKSSRTGKSKVRASAGLASSWG